MIRLLQFFILALPLVGCATPARTAALMREGGALRLDGDRAMGVGDHERAAAAYGESYHLYLDCQQMARDLVANEKGRDLLLLVRCEGEAGQALPETALLAAEACSGIGLRSWESGDKWFDAGRLGEALLSYEAARGAYLAEKRWLRRARREVDRLVADGREGSYEAQRAAIDADLAQVEIDRETVERNLALTFHRIEERHPGVAQAILDGFVTGLEGVGIVMEHVGLAILEVISEPLFWEFCLRVCEVTLRCLCCFKS